MKSLLFAVSAITLVVLGVSTGYAGNAKPTQEDLQKSYEHQTKGNIADDEGKADEAIKEYKQALTYAPDDTNTLFNLGTVYLKVNKAADAALVFEKVVKIDAKDTEAYNLLGLAYRGCGRVQDAVKTWEKSLSIDPSQKEPKKFIEEARNI